MKRKLVIIIFLFVSIQTYAIEEYNLKENILLDKGYIKYNPEDYFYTQIFNDAYEKIFNENIFLNPPGIRSVRLDVADGFIYNLFFVLHSNKALPNILVIAYFEYNGITHRYYKINYNLKGEEMFTTIGELIVFY